MKVREEVGAKLAALLPALTLDDNTPKLELMNLRFEAHGIAEAEAIDEGLTQMLVSLDLNVIRSGSAPRVV